MKYLLIAGSRTFEERELLYRVVDEVLAGDNEAVIIEGGAAGADSLAKDYALEHGLELLEFKADWKQYGRAAGPKRNDEMVNYIKEKDGEALYFWDEESKGTKQCIESAKRKEVPVRVWSTKRGAFL